MIGNLHKRLSKNNAISLICYDSIPPGVWQVVTKWRKDKKVKVNVTQFTHWKRRVFQIEFVTNDLTVLEDDLKRIDPRFLKKISMLKSVVRKVKRQKNLWAPWFKTKISNVKDDIEDLFCYYVKTPICKIFKK